MTLVISYHEYQSSGEAHVPQCVGAGGLGVAPGLAPPEGGLAGLQTLLSSVRKGRCERIMRTKWRSVLFSVHYREELRAVAVLASQFSRLHGDALEKFR